jgi:hypothetical protein
VAVEREVVGVRRALEEVPLVFVQSLELKHSLHR